MQKGITTEQTLQVASRMRNFGIYSRSFPSLSEIPSDPERDTHETLRFIRKIKRLDPKFRDHYLSLHSGATARRDVREHRRTDFTFPTTPEEWATKQWMDFTLKGRSEYPMAETQDQAADREL